jgi:heme exporter protein D
MQWESWQAFFYMGGRGFYVWLSFGLTALCVLWEVIALRKRHQAALRLTRLLSQND